MKGDDIGKSRNILEKLKLSQMNDMFEILII